MYKKNTLSLSFLLLLTSKIIFSTHIKWVGMGWDSLTLEAKRENLKKFYSPSLPSYIWKHFANALRRGAVSQEHFFHHVGLVCSIDEKYYMCS